MVKNDRNTGPAVSLLSQYQTHARTESAAAARNSAIEASLHAQAA